MKELLLKSLLPWALFLSLVINNTSNADDFIEINGNMYNVIDDFSIGEQCSNFHEQPSNSLGLWGHLPIFSNSGSKDNKNLDISEIKDTKAIAFIIHHKMDLGLMLLNKIHIQCSSSRPECITRRYAQSYQAEDRFSGYVFVSDYKSWKQTYERLNKDSNVEKVTPVFDFNLPKHEDVNTEVKYSANHDNKYDK